MQLSYRTLIIRDYCSSLNPDVNGVPFTIEELILIRAYLADLRAAPVLADAPVNLDKLKSENSNEELVFRFGQVVIICKIISTLSNPTPNQISRLQVLDIRRIDLQLSNVGMI